jgi:hypothetical protein
MRTMLRVLVVLWMILACVGCIYSRKVGTGTNTGAGSGDRGGPWTHGEPAGGGGSPALTDRDR